MVLTLKEELTREDVFIIFGNLSEEETQQKMEAAKKIADGFGIEYETIMEKTIRIRNGETLGGSIYLNNVLEEFARV